MDPVLKVTYSTGSHCCPIRAHTERVSSEEQNKTQNSAPSLNYLLEDLISIHYLHGELLPELGNIIFFYSSRLMQGDHFLATPFYSSTKRTLPELHW